MPSTKPFFNIRDLSAKTQDYLVEKFHDGDWNVRSTFSSASEVSNWKPLDTMLNLFSVGLVTESDLLIWQSMVFEVRDACRKRGTLLSEDVNGVSRQLTYILRHDVYSACKKN